MSIVTWSSYSKFPANALGGEVAGDTFAIDFLSDTIKALLTTSSHTVNLDTHETLSDITNDVSAGGGYSTGGVVLTTKTVVVTPADSWTVVRANTTAYAVGDIVRPATPNGFVYICAVAGTSTGAPPTFSTTMGRETADGTVVWSTVGRAVMTLDCDDPSWSAATITARNIHIYKSTGVAGTSPLMIVGQFDVDAISTGGTFVVNVPVLGFCAQVRQ
jgi:hypothetical protein